MTAIVALLVVSTATAQKLPAKRAQPVAVMRLRGLERVYFEHVAGPGDALLSGTPSVIGVRKRGEPIVPPQFIRDLLPDVLSTTLNGKPRPLCTDEIDNELAIRDVPVDLQGKRELFIRQIVDDRHPRISELWWALYDGGRRSDVWYFSASALWHGKLLSNYEIEELLPSKCGFELRIRGTMFRPNGNWWITGKTFVFSLNHNTIVLSGVQNLFGVFHSFEVSADISEYEMDRVYVSTETEIHGRVETRSYDAVREAVLLQCEYRDPLLQEECSDFVWQDWERVARCVTRNSEARSSYRKRTVPSFIERGGSAQK